MKTSKRLHPAEKYAREVIDGRISACSHVKLACQRYFDDLKNLPKKGFTFDREKAAAVINWVSTYCRHYKGNYAGKPLELLPWQQFVYWNIFGWKDKKGNRRFKYAYVEVPKKNGKTTGFLAPMGLYMLVGDGEPGSEVYFAAGSRDQANIAFADVRAMIKKSPDLSEVLRPWVREIKPTKNTAEYGIDDEFKCHPVSSEAGNLDGKNVFFSGIDEFHNHITSEVFNIMSSGMIGREQPIQFTITTAGFNKYSPCYKYRNTCIDILNGVVEDNSTFAVIYGVDEGDDWQDEKTWIKANPSIGNGKEIERMRQEYKQKKLQGSAGIVEFKTKQLNMWVDAAVTWVPDESVKAVMDSSAFPELRHSPCCAGLDLAASRDIAAMASAWRGPDGKVYAKLKYYLPADVLEERSSLDEKHPYIEFAKKGFITLTPGNTTDYEFIRRDITGNSAHDSEINQDALMLQNNLISVGYDQWNATHLVSQISADGAPVNEVRQSFHHLNYPTKQLEKLILSKEIVLENDPVLRWMFTNVKIITDAVGNIRPDKKTAEKKIDGIIALLMALSELFRSETETGDTIPETYRIK